MIREGERFKDIKTKKVYIVKRVTKDNTVILQRVGSLSETFVSQKDLNRFFERIDLVVAKNIIKNRLKSLWNGHQIG